MRAERVHCPAEPRARFAERQRRHRRLVERIGGISGQPRDAHHAVVLGEERLQRGIVDRPVVGDAVERLDLEVGWVHARIMRGVDDGAAADAVEIDHLDRRIGVVDRIVGRARATVGIDGEIAEQARLPVPPVAGIVLGFTQSPCSRQTIRILVSARLQATAAPDAPEPMIRTSTLSSIDFFSSRFSR